jgi:hypothetical protein
MDIVLLLTCLALLLIDLQIKNDIVKQAKELEEVLSGQSRAPEHGDIPDMLRSGILRSDDPGEPAVASENISEFSVNRARPSKRNSSTSQRNSGNNDQGISTADK